MNARDELKSDLARIYSQALRLEIAPTDIPSNHLVEHLGIDSIGAMEVLIWVEDVFGIVIEDEDLSPDLVDSMDILADYVLSRTDAKSVPSGTAD